MNTNWGEQLVAIRGEIARLQKQVGLIEQLAALDKEDGKPVANKPKAAPKPAVPGEEPKKRGRPRKDPAEASGDGSNEEKSLKLPALLRTIGQSANKPMTMPELVDMVKDAGYKSDAKDYHNMVYQGMQKLVKAGHFKKTVAPADPSVRAYEWVASDAA